MEKPGSQSLSAEPSLPERRVLPKLCVVAAGVVILASALVIVCFSRGGNGSGLSEPEIAEILQPLANADRITLYSFDGHDFRLASRQPGAAGEFHGCQVLGTVDVTDRATRKSIVEAVEAGLRDARVTASCFWPHHALRVENDGRTIDYIICFHCSNYRIQSGDSVIGAGATTNAAEKLLNRILAEAGIAVAK